jgi:ATP-dependent Clp protease ATP-binding subunit ClpB
MDLNKYTEKAQEAIVAAQQLADREGHPEITPEHLLLTLLEQRDGIVPSIVRKMNADPAALAAAVRGELGRAPSARGGSKPT